MPLALSSSWALIISLFFYNILLSCTILLQDKNTCTKYLLETIIKVWLCIPALHAQIRLLVNFYYVFICIRAPDLKDNGQSICAHDFLKTTYHRCKYSSTRMYSQHLSYEHPRTQPNENIQEVTLAHLDIDDVMWYCLCINQACGCSYDSIFFNWLCRERKKKE